MYTKEEKIDKINSTVRWVAYGVFYHVSDKFKFVKAYDKLRGRVSLDHGLTLPKGKNGMFSGLTEEEVELVFQSSKNLAKMYSNVIEKKAKLKEVC